MKNCAEKLATVKELYPPENLDTTDFLSNNCLTCLVNVYREWDHIYWPWLHYSCDHWLCFPTSYLASDFKGSSCTLRRLSHMFLNVFLFRHIFFYATPNLTSATSLIRSSVNIFT